MPLALRCLVISSISSGEGWVENEVFRCFEALGEREGSVPLAALVWVPGGAALIAGGADLTADSTASSSQLLPAPQRQLRSPPAQGLGPTGSLTAEASVASTGRSLSSPV